MKNKILKCIAIFVGIGGLIVVAMFAYFWVYLNNVVVRDTKDYNPLKVEENEIVDYKTFLEPTDNFTALNQIDYEIREEVAKYMKDNNYKLKSGDYQFIRNNPTFEELLECFDFEIIKSQ